MTTKEKNSNIRIIRNRITIKEKVLKEWRKTPELISHASFKEEQIRLEKAIDLTEKLTREDCERSAKLSGTRRVLNMSESDMAMIRFAEEQERNRILTEIEKIMKDKRFEYYRGELLMELEALKKESEE